MDKFPVLIEADRRECIANLRAFMEADKHIQARMSGSPTGPSSIITHSTNKTGKHSPARSPRSAQADFSANKTRRENT